MSQKHEISCWKCHEMTSLETRNEFDGCCWACGEEIDLDDYLIKAMDKRDEHYAALSAVTAERDRLLASKLYWVAPAGSGLVRCVTDERYRKFSPSIRAKYDPVCCVDAAMAAKEA